MKAITILLADDHQLVCKALHSLLRLSEDIKVVGEAGNGREALELVRTLRPDVILMDIAMPVLNGLEATRQILAADPAAKVLILSAHSDDEFVDLMHQAGVAGFLEKQTSVEILTNAIREVAKGGRYFSPAIARRLREARGQPRDRNGLVKANGTRLTSRESEVLQLVAAGLANKEVAAELGISIKTVEKHRQKVLDKLNIHNAAGLTRYAVAQRLVEANEVASAKRQMNTPTGARQDVG